MSKWHATLQCGAVFGLALFFSDVARADESLRERVHREYKHQSYMLIEGPDGPHLYLFSTGDEPVRAAPAAIRNAALNSAFAKTQSADPRIRTRGLTELAGVPDPEALNIALSLLGDPVESVRVEAQQLILDHPQGASLVAALGLVDEDEEE
ncbi:MAG: hypothetical protein OER91_00105 [Gammaproteobacteria bacterium]|nr:hypothetical protein [Gammaproteobacteria bacterium]